MIVKAIQFKILRFKAGAIDPPRFQVYLQQVSEDKTVMECLEAIRVAQDPTLMYRHACHHAACGTCACLINGTERLACVTNVWELDTDIVTLAPLRGFNCLGDLVVDMVPFFSGIDHRWPSLRPSERTVAREDFQRFENCLECGCCVSACPVSGRNGKFMGPATLSALHRELLKNPDLSQDLLKRAGQENGVRLCTRALACSRVCPGAVYPSGHISKLKKKLKDRDG